MRGPDFGLIVPVLLALAAGGVQAQPANGPSTDHGAHHPAAPATSSSSGSAAMTDGEVRRVDRENGRITIRHGTIANLDMPPMTMVFRVRDAAVLDRIKEGQAIRFSAERIDGAFTVTQLEPAQ